MISRQTIGDFLGLALRFLVMLQVLIVRVTAEEKFIMETASHINLAGKVVSATQTILDFLFGPGSDRWRHSVHPCEADG